MYTNVIIKLTLSFQILSKFSELVFVCFFVGALAVQSVEWWRKKQAKSMQSKSLISVVRRAKRSRLSKPNRTQYEKFVFYECVLDTQILVSAVLVLFLQ